MADEPAIALAPRLQLDLGIRAKAWADSFPDADPIVRRAAAAAVAAALADPRATWLVELRAKPLEISVVLADDALISGLNRDYRHRDSATNVLSFAAFDRKGLADEVPSDPAMPLVLGDVVVARETLEREAAAQWKAPSDHLAHLVVHGVLHLLGFDHVAEEDAEAMEALESIVLTGLGRPDPYGDSATARMADTELSEKRL